MDSVPRGAATESAGATATNGNGRRGMVELARMAVEDTIRLVQQEIQLAKIELREMLVSNIRGGILLAAAGLFALLLVVMLLVALVEWIPNHTLAALITAAVFLVLTAILVFTGIKSLKIGAPPKTMTTLKEDAEWARQVLKRNGK
ncbi:MAG TPA: phage holin family protein [Candidatus Dormibacteraeota bacterium]|nr:phage holin family protein [Candidatus Dormibacteraeota bacterium]